LFYFIDPVLIVFEFRKVLSMGNDECILFESSIAIDTQDALEK